jgi:chemosensory pili system protein ChpC
MRKSMNDAADRKELPQSLPCLLLPLQKGGLLLPNASVPEIILARQLSSTLSSTFILGMLPWRNVQLPIISFEGLCDGQIPNNLALRRVAIIKGLQNPERLPFYGIVVSAIPQVLHLSADDVKGIEGEERVGCRQHVSIAGRAMMLPDCDQIEARILRDLHPE